MKLWIFLLDTRTPRKILLDNKKVSFERNILKKIQYIRFHDALKIKLILSIRKTETRFEIRVRSSTYVGVSKTSILRNYFYRDIDLDSV